MENPSGWFLDSVMELVAVEVNKTVTVSLCQQDNEGGDSGSEPFRGHCRAVKRAKSRMRKSNEAHEQGTRVQLRWRKKPAGKLKLSRAKQVVWHWT